MIRAVGADTCPNGQEQYLHCPFCSYAECVSEEDPDASFSQILNHIEVRHRSFAEGMSPEVLWPRIEVSGG